MDIKTGVAADILKSVTTESKLSVNQRLYEKGVITEEMYKRAKELILKM